MEQVTTTVGHHDTCCGVPMESTSCRKWHPQPRQLQSTVIAIVNPIVEFLTSCAKAARLSHLDSPLEKNPAIVGVKK